MSSSWSREDLALRRHLTESLPRYVEKVHREAGVSLCLLVVYDDFLLPDALIRLRNMGVKVANYTTDTPTQWYRLIEGAKYYDVIASAHLAKLELLAAYCPTLYLPMAADPKDFRANNRNANSIEISEKYLVSFVGGYSPTREQVLVELIRAGIPLSLFGRWRAPEAGQKRLPFPFRRVAHDVQSYLLPRWRAEGFGPVVAALRRLTSKHLPKVGRFAMKALGEVCTEARPTFQSSPVPSSDIGDVFRHSLINLGFSQSEGHVGDPKQPCWIRGRDFEVPASGGFYLVQEAPERDALFKEGEHVETWSSVAELIEKIRYYLNHQEDSRRIARAGHLHAAANHMWRHRMDILLSYLGISNELA